MTTDKKQSDTRPPVVAIMGHVDHGKSTLLDYIRKSNIVEGEAGGITQHLSAYEAVHKTEKGEQKITFLDTPGHAAFSDMRNRGATIADIAILIISAEDSVQAQTKEAIKTIQENNIPFVVAITKIDKSNVNIDKVKTDLLESEVYLEGYGGDIPCTPISSKTGEGVNELLDMILLVAEVEEFTGDPNIPAVGFIVESHLDEKRGISGTLLIKDGTITQGQYVVAEDAMASTRIIEDFIGKKIKDATFSSPIIIRGFSSLPQVGSMFETFDSKKACEKAMLNNKNKTLKSSSATHISEEDKRLIIPLIIKSDALGTAEAIEQEIAKLNTDEVLFKIIKKGVGAINESDIKLAASDTNSIIVGFHVSADKKVSDTNDGSQVTIETFTIIYKLTEWLEEERDKRKPIKDVEEIHGSIKLLKIFSTTKKVTVCGGKVTDGIVHLGEQVKIMRNQQEIGRGKVTNLQEGKSDTKQVEAGNEFGMMIESNSELTEGDVLEVFTIVQK